VDTDSPSSFGLGLVQALARQLGSRMQVETGNGTAFRFEIPLE
jgi:two-component sensor histidine kinase